MGVKQEAFSLIEILMVLVITSLIIGFLSYLPSQKIGQHFQEKIFKDQLTSQLYLAQDRAIMDQSPILVLFAKDGNLRITHSQTQELLAVMEPPEHLRLLNTFSFYYLPDGRINQFGSVYFAKENRAYFALVFQLGSGQFEFQQQSFYAH